MVGCWHGYLSGARCRLAYAQLMPLPLTVSCFSKIQIGFSFLVPAYSGSPGKRAVKRVCLCVCVCVFVCGQFGAFWSAGATRCAYGGGVWHGRVGRLLHAKFYPYSCRGRLCPQKMKKRFQNINAPKGHIPCMIFRKFSRFMERIMLS